MPSQVANKPQPDKGFKEKVCGHNHATCKECNPEVSEKLSWSMRWNKNARKEKVNA